MTYISRKYDMAKSQTITMPFKVDYQLKLIISKCCMWTARRTAAFHIVIIYTSLFIEETID